MSTSSPVPVLRGDRGTELRSAGEELVLRRPDSELRIPFAAIARVHAERRSLAVELTAPAEIEPTVYRVTDVSAAAAGVFADAVNAALPERAAQGATADGATLVVYRSLVVVDDEEDTDDSEVLGGLPSHGKQVMYAGCAAAAVPAVVAGVLGGDWSRAIAALLLGAAGVSLTWCAAMMCAMVWREWYLPRYGITVDGLQVFREDHGDTIQTFTATDGVPRHIHGNNKGNTVRIAYHPRNPAFAVTCSSTGDRVLTVVMSLVVAALAGFMDYGTYALVLPAFTD